jgi:ATP-dependent Clp protease ATP-binding subunit ClpC
MPGDDSSSNPRFEWEKYAERARLVIGLAHKEARTLRHDRIDTMHLLLGLLREREGVAARLLADVGIDEDGVRAALIQAARPGDHEPSG